MLNELYVIAESLKRCGLSVIPTHPYLRNNPKQPGFVLGIAPDGSVGSVEFRDREWLANLWQIDSGNNGESFPGFNLTWPVYDVRQSSSQIESLLKEKEPIKRTEMLAAICSNSPLSFPNLSKQQKAHFLANYRELAAKAQALFDAVPEKYQALSVLLNRVVGSLLTPEEFLRSFAEAIVRSCLDGRLQYVPAVEEALIGKWDAKSKSYACRLTLYLDVFDRSQYKLAVTDPQMKAILNERLQERMPGRSFAKGGKGAEQKVGIDAFTGVEADIQTRFAPLNLSALGTTIIFSMSSESRCHTRYGLIESDIFPTGLATSLRIQDALRFLTGTEQERKTWRKVPNSKTGKKIKPDLLIAYLEDKPDCAAFLADLFAESADFPDSEELMFNQVAEKVCTALNGEPAAKPDSLIRVLVLSVADRGRTQLVLGETYQVQEIFQAAEEWRRAAANHPWIAVLLPPSQKGGQGRLASPICPYPAAVMECLNLQWTGFGTESKRVATCSLQQIFEVFLKQTGRSQSTASRLLVLGLQRATDLLLALGQKQHSDAQKELSASARATALTAISTLAILLSKLGR